MKNRIIVTIMSTLIVAGLLSSCDLFDKVDDVSFNSVFEKSLTVDNAGAGTYSDAIILDATADPEINKYKDKITALVVNSITYRVSNYDGPVDATFNGDMLFGTNGTLGTIAIEGLSLSSTTEQELQFSQSEIDAIGAQLKDNNTVTVTMAGTFSDGPVSFVVTVKVDATITADAL